MDKKFKIKNIVINTGEFDSSDHDYAKAINYCFLKLGDIGCGIVALIIVIFSLYNLLDIIGLAI